MRKLIIAEGLPCSGKSTTARYIAEQLGMTFIDEGSGAHPADYEFDAYLTESDLGSFNAPQRELIAAQSKRKSGGYIVPLGAFSGELFEKLLKYKIYDFLPWEKERPIMLDKWRDFARNCNGGFVFNCVLLQNPMCETMIRFGFDVTVSEAYIREICGIIAPLSPFVVYLRNTEVYDSVKRASAERGDDWLNAVIDYHCNGKYGRSQALSGFDGYISALEERQRREVEILRGLDIESIVLDNPQKDWDKAYSDILAKIK